MTAAEEVGVVLTVREFLALPAVRDAEPEEAVAAADGSTGVRWVHSSEIYEIGPLLSTGDLLLTTGLGLSGADAGARRHWVRDLAGRGIAAVAVELGRSLPTLPPEVLDEARRARLPLYVLHRVVPFIRICEEANGVILQADARRLRTVDAVLRQVHEALAAGGGPPALVTCAAEATGSPVALVTRSGQLVAAAGLRDQRATDRLLRRPAVTAPVRVWDVEWGAILLGGGHEDVPGLELLADRLAAVAALAVAAAGSGSAGDPRAALLGDLLADTVPGTRELLLRAGLADFHPLRAARILGLAATAPDPRRVIAGWLRTAAEHGLELLADRVRGEALGLVAVHPAPERRDPAGWLAGVLPDGDAITTVGPPVPLAEAGHSLRAAHAALPTATLLGRGTVVTRELVLPRLLGELDEQRLLRLVDDALAPLATWDTAHGSDLVHTLAVHLRHAGNRTATALALHVHRQSLYQRLARIEELLGHPVDDPAAHEHLVVATAAAQVLHARDRRSHRRAGR